MLKLGRSGVTSMEFALIGLIFFVLTFGMFDVGRYGITVFSLRSLANAVARQTYVNCYQTQIVNGHSPSSCTSNPLTATQMRTVAPFLYVGGLTPSVSITPSASTLTVRASQPGFTMLVKNLLPGWGTGLDAPSATVSLPF